MKLQLPFFFIVVILAVWHDPNCFASGLKVDSVYSDTTETYFISYQDKLGLYAYGINKYSRFSFIDLESERELQYQPNGQYNFGLGFSYKWLGFGVAVSPGFINQDDDEFGDTRRIDLQADLFARKMIYTVNAQIYQGFYWNNKRFRNLAPAVYIRPDLQSISFGLSALYTFNHREYSFRAVFNHNEWQQRSAGTFLVGGGFSFYNVGGDSALVPGFVEPGFDTLKLTHNLNTLNLGLAGGYAHTFVIKKNWFISMSLILGPSIQTLNGLDQGDKQLFSFTGVALRTKTLFGMGYANEKHFFGMNSSNDLYLLNANQYSQLIYSFGAFRIFYGRRFTIK